MSGLVQRLSICSDTREQLVHAISILLVWDKNVSHYATGVDKDGAPWLALRWHETGGGLPLIAPMSDPESIADQVYSWLKTVGYKDVHYPDTDGDNSKGWSITNHGVKVDDSEWRDSGTFYDVFTVQPAYVTYGK
jgi:hypothetical protein